MVSAIITTYKRDPDIVLRALDSVIAQTYRDIEIIMVDDSPVDYSKRADVHAAIERRQEENLDITIRYIAHPKNMGACVARNTGLDAAIGDYVAYLDDDDEWLPTKIEKQMEVMQKTDVAMVYCGNLCKNDGTGITRVARNEYLKGKVFKELLYRNFIASTSYPLIRKSCLKKVGGFDPLMQSAQDYDVWLRLAEQYEIDYVAEPLVLYHEHEGERITTNPQKKISGLERINLKYNDYLQVDRKLWWARNIVITQYYALNNEGKKSIELWCKCVFKCPERIIRNCSYFLTILSSCIKAG